MKRALLVTMLLAGSVLAQPAQTSKAQTPTCSPGPGEIVNDLVTVQELLPDGFAGPATNTLYAPTGEVLVVHVDSATKWLGVVQSLADVRIGMVLEPVGRRQQDCSVLVINMLSDAAPETPTIAPAAIPAQTPSAPIVPLPSTGEGAANDGGPLGRCTAALMAAALVGGILGLAGLNYYLRRVGRPRI